MPEANQTPHASIVDGGTPTDEEARLAAQIDTIGENPTEEPAATPPAPAAAEGGAPTAPDPASADATAAAAADAAAAGSGDDGADEAATAAAAAAAATATPPRAPQTPPAATPTDVIGEAPRPPMDFEEEYAKNQKAFDDGEVEAGEFQKRLREITREEAGFTARSEIYKERVQTAQQRAASEFSTAAAAWEAEHKDFMANPLYADAMQQAIVAIDKREPGLAPADLLKKAEAAAFQFTHYTPPIDTTAADAATKKAAALAEANKGRTPAKVPATLGATPTAAHVDAAPTNSAYASLDSLDIDTLENQLARMKPDDVEKYLADAPGANANGQ